MNNLIRQGARVAHMRMVRARTRIDAVEPLNLRTWPRSQPQPQLIGKESANLNNPRQSSK